MLRHLLVFAASCFSTAFADWRVSLQTAMSTHQSGDLVSAAKHYRKALSDNPELMQHPGILTNYGLAVQAEGKTDEATAAFRSAVSLTPDSADGYFNLARSLTDGGAHAEAQDALHSCLALNPTDAEAYYDLGLSMLTQGDPSKADEAVAAVRACIALAPDDGKSWVALGDGLAAQRRWEESGAAYKEATRLRPEHGPSWSCLGNAFEEQSKRAEAEKYWRHAISLGGAEGFDGLAGCYLNLAGMLRRSERSQEANDLYAGALNVNPRSVEAYMGLGRCLAAPSPGAPGTKVYLQSLRETYGAAIDVAPDHAAAYVAIGEAMRMYGLQGGCDEFDGKGAHDFYSQALALIPNNTCALTHVAFGERAPCDAKQAAELTMTSACHVDGESDAYDDLGGVVEEADSLDAFGGGRAAPTVETLSAPTPLKTSEQLATALSLWRRNGLAVFPSLLDGVKTDALLRFVRAAQEGNHTVDYTPVTRDSGHRCHKALPVGEAREALEQIAARLQPFLESVLGTASPALLESGFMITAPGADAQNFHRDVAPAVVSRSSMTVSIQVSLVDTAAEQGSLEVIPGSQYFDASISDRTRQQTMPAVRVAVPRGTVTVYALHTMHRGSSNSHTADRPFYFFTLTGVGLVPPGLAYTIQPEDVGQWEMVGGKMGQRP